MKFSANLGFLWSDLPLPLAIEKAAASGFDAVEFHWPYDYRASELAKALSHAGIPAIGINAPCGDLLKGDFGTAAIVGREFETRKAVDLALDYAAEIGCHNVHLLAGKANQTEAARSVFVENLNYACERAKDVAGASILIEPINTIDIPEYFLSHTAQAAEILELVQAQNLRIMFDCYHVARMGGSVVDEYKSVIDHVGHVQFAGVPDRAEPDRGTVDFSQVLAEIESLGWEGWFGAEYKPTEIFRPDFAWLHRLQNL